MARRKPNRRLTCTEPDCNEVGRWEFETQREYVEHAKRVPTWKCSRHKYPDEVLSPTNRVTVSQSTVVQRDSGRYFEIGSLGHGFQHGPGFRVWANDVEPGTVLRVTAEIVPPDARPGNGTLDKDLDPV